MLLLLGLWSSIASTDTLSATEVRAAYPTFLHIRIDSVAGRWMTSARADTLPSDRPLAGFVRERRAYLSYLAASTQERLRGADLSSPAGRDSVRRAFYTLLRTDAGYERSILGALHGYLKAHGGMLRDYSPGRPTPISQSRAVSVAARFYNPNVLLPDGRIGVHICVVENGMFGSLAARDLALEAVAYAAVSEDTDRPDSVSIAGKDFALALSRVKEVPKHLTRPERVRRAQKVMWSTLEKGSGVRALMNAMVRQWPGLPFVLSPS